MRRSEGGIDVSFFELFKLLASWGRWPSPSVVQTFVARGSSSRFGSPTGWLLQGYELLPFFFCSRLGCERACGRRLVGVGDGITGDISSSFASVKFEFRD